MHLIKEKVNLISFVETRASKTFEGLKTHFTKFELIENDMNIVSELLEGYSLEKREPLRIDKDIKRSSHESIAFILNDYERDEDHC